MLRNRILIGILWIVSLVGISFYGGTISYGFFIAVTLLPVLSFIYLLFVRIRFSVFERLEGKTFVANHPIPYFFTLQNESRFAFAGVKVYFYSDFSSLTGLSDGAEYELLPGTGVSRDTTLLCRYRGSYNVGIRTIEITDFLRLFRLRYKNREPLEVHIKPDTVTLSDLGGIRLPRLLARESLQSGGVPETAVRDYLPGDPMRRIHWKAFAKENRLLVRRISGEEQQQVSIFQSTCRPDAEPAAYLPTENKLLELSLALSAFFLRRGIPVRAAYRTRSTMLCRMNSSDSFNRFYELCSGLEFSKDQPDSALFSVLAKHPETVGGHLAFFLLSEWSAEAERFARTLNGNGIAVAVCLVTADASAVPSGLSLPRTEMIQVSPDVDLREVFV